MYTNKRYTLGSPKPRAEKKARKMIFPHYYLQDATSIHEGFQFPTPPVGPRTVRCTAFWQHIPQYRYIASQSSEMDNHRPLECFWTILLFCVLTATPDFLMAALEEITHCAFRLALNSGTLHRECRRVDCDDPQTKQQSYQRKSLSFHFWRTRGRSGPISKAYIFFVW